MKNLILSTSILLATLAAPALATAANAIVTTTSQDVAVDIDSTVCKPQSFGMRKDSIDNVVTLFPVFPAADGSAGMVDSINKNAMRVPADIANTVRRKHLPAWFAYHFKASAPALAAIVGGAPGQLGATKGLTLNLVVADKKCRVGDDINMDIKGLSRPALVNIALAQRQVQPDGSFRPLTKEDADWADQHEIPELYIVINAYLNKQVMANFDKYFGKYADTKQP